MTYTVDVACSVTGGCNDTHVTFPSTTIAGDGATTDFGAWVGNSSCSGVTRTASGGVVDFSYGDIPTGAGECTFNVVAPEYQTWNGATVTITPTISGSNFTSSTGSAATLTLTAGHNDSVATGVPSKAGSGLPFAFTISFSCGENGDYTGDVGLSSLSISDQLPSNFTYSSSSSNDGNGTLNYDPSTHTLTYVDSTGASCADPPLNVSNVIVITVEGTASTGTTPDPINDTICNQASSTFTYIDGTPGSSASAQACATVIELASTAKKTVTTTSLGQYTFSADGKSYPYTYPGNWDQSNDPVRYSLQVGNSANAKQAGLEYAIQDPLPCLDGSGPTYSSPAPGGACAAPGIVPTEITATGFSPTSSDVVTLKLADGTTTTVAYSSDGWSIPTSLSAPVREIDFPQFPEEANNSFAAITFTVDGYAASNAPAGSLLVNTMTSTSYASTTQVDSQTSSASLLIADPSNPSGTTVLYPSLTAGSGPASCTEDVQFNNSHNGALANRIEITSAPSQEVVLDLLAPPGATVSPTDLTTYFDEAFSFKGIGNGQQFQSGTVNVVVTNNYEHTGRNLYEWTIPAGVVTVPGDYQIVPANRNLPLSLPVGCAGTYVNDMTLGYGAPVSVCNFDNYSSQHYSTPPLNPSDGDLDYNGVGTDNYCGFSANDIVTPVNPAFSVAKTVQGNLDTSPVSDGGTGNVSPSGGTATYNVTFTNTGQSNLTDPVMYDLLPRVGDTHATSTDPRGSQFPVSLTGVGTPPAGVTVSYSTAADPCRPEVLPDASNPGCTNDWSTTPPSPLSSTTALRVAHPGPVNVSGGAGSDTFSVSYTVSTPNGLTTGEVAWNTVGATADAGGTPMTPAESSPTGLQASAPPDTVLANDDTASTTAPNPVSTDVLANDSTSNSAFSLDPASVTVTSGPSDGQTSVDTATGAITYTPNSGFSGSDSYTYQVCDTSTPAVCGSANVDITVEPAFTATESAATIPAGTSTELGQQGLPADATGTVTFTTGSGAGTTVLCTLALPGPPSTCATPATLAPGTYTISAHYSGSSTYEGVDSTNTLTLTVVPQTLTGESYALGINASLSIPGISLLGIPARTVTLIPPTTVKSTGPVSTTASGTTANPCAAHLTVRDVVLSGDLCASVSTNRFPGRSVANASVANVAVGVPTLPAIDIQGVASTSTTTCSASSGSTTIAYLKIGNTVVIAKPTAIAPNTTITVGLITLVLNQQIPFGGVDKGLTVNAVALNVNALGLAHLNLVVAHAQSDIANC